jgi:hypothetical protein
MIRRFCIVAVAALLMASALSPDADACCGRRDRRGFGRWGGHGGCGTYSYGGWRHGGYGHGWGYGTAPAYGYGPGVPSGQAAPAGQAVPPPPPPPG